MQSSLSSVLQNLLGRPKRSAAMAISERVRGRAKKRANRVLDSDASGALIAPTVARPSLIPSAGHLILPACLLLGDVYACYPCFAAEDDYCPGGSDETSSAEEEEEEEEEVESEAASVVESESESVVTPAKKVWRLGFSGHDREHHYYLENQLDQLLCINTSKELLMQTLGRSAGLNPS